MVLRWPNLSVVRCPRYTCSRRFLSNSNLRTVKPADPFGLVAPELAQIRATLVDLLGSGHPKLDQAAKYYFQRPSKHLRPLLILLFSQATNGLGSKWPEKHWMSLQHGPGGTLEDLDRALTRPDVLNDWNPSIPDKTSSFHPASSIHTREPLLHPPEPPPIASAHVPSLTTPPTILPSQIRLAQIVEMIHAASLLHDDVIDESPLRRGVASAPVAFGSKASILAGNFILGRASTALARLGDLQVTELISSIITNLVEGEILQMREVLASQDPLRQQEDTPTPWNLYMKKTYMKTASLMAKGARGAVALGGCVEGEIYREVAYAYGRNLGLAFQLIDDVLDYEAGEASLGKPGGADLQLGLATGPALYAWEEFPELGPLIERKFNQKGDVELARDCVRRSLGVERTRLLATEYATQARKVLEPLPDSDAKDALGQLTNKVLNRTS